MAIQIVDNFQVNIAESIDNRLVVGPSQFYTDKDNLPYKYTGMRVWDLNDGVNGVPYVWTGTTFSTESSSGISGSGTPGFIPKFIGGGNVLDDSIIKEDGSNIGIGIATPDKKLTVAGDIKATAAGGFYGVGANITNINASNITTGELQLARLQNTAQTGSILVSGGSQPVYTYNMTVDSAPTVNSTVPGIITTLYFKNFNTTRLYSNHNVGDFSEFFIEAGSTELKLSSGYIESNQPIRLPNGTAAAPSLSFANDIDTGFYYNTGLGGSIYTTIDGTVILTVRVAEIHTPVPVRVHYNVSGSAGNPSLKVKYNNCGIYLNASNQFGLSLFGSEKINITSSTITLKPQSSVGSGEVYTTGWFNSTQGVSIRDGNYPSGGYRVTHMYRYTGSSDFNIRLDDGAGANWQGLFQFFVNGSFRLNGTIGGGMVARKDGGGSWATLSDKRFKKDIKPLSNSIDKLSNLKGVEFNWKSTGEKEIGFIADDVMEFFPNWVSNQEPSYDEKAFLPGAENIKTLTLPNELFALMVESIKYLKSENEELKQRVENLES